MKEDENKMSNVYEECSLCEGIILVSTSGDYRDSYETFGKKIICEECLNKIRVKDD